MKIQLIMIFAASFVTACSSPARAPVESLTHQWSTKPGASLFMQVSLGATPEAAADSLMTVMPTLVHQVGERCRNHPEAARPGEFTLAFNLRAGKLSTPTAEPWSPLAQCVIEGLPVLAVESAAAFSEMPLVGVMLRLEHAPVPG